VGGDEVGLVKDADFAGGGFEGELFAGVAVRDGIGIGFEFDAEGDGRLDRLDDRSVVRSVGQRDEEFAFFFEQIDGPLAGRAVDADVGHRVPPVESRGIDLVEMVEIAAHEETLLYITDAGFDAALFMRRTLAAEHRFESMESGKLHEARIETNFLLRTLQNDALQVVVNDLRRVAAEEAKRVFVAA
jgi:hypothetical protein